MWGRDSAPGSYAQSVPAHTSKFQLSVLRFPSVRLGHHHTSAAQVKRHASFTSPRLSLAAVLIRVSTRHSSPVGIRTPALSVTELVLFIDFFPVAASCSNPHG